MARICQHFEHLDGVRLEGAVEDEETGKLEIALDIGPGNDVDLYDQRLYFLDDTT
jgi:hypothetical protein